LNRDVQRSIGRCRKGLSRGSTALAAIEQTYLEAAQADVEQRLPEAPGVMKERHV
jgi:hypothetical protein